jgi:hypothetical protein
VNVDPYTLAWLAWIALFFGVEGTALVKGRAGGTLSEKVWQWFAIIPRKDSAVPDGWTRTRRVALLSFVTWLGVHFLTGGTFV